MKQAGGRRGEDESEAAMLPILLEWIFTGLLLVTHAQYSSEDVWRQNSLLAQQSICLIHANLPLSTLVFHRICDILFVQETSADSL